MALSFDQIRELERLGIDNVRQRLRYAGAGPGSIVPGLGDGRMLRGEVEDWLAAKDNTLRERAEKLQEDTLWWAKDINTMLSNVEHNSHWLGHNGLRKVDLRKLLQKVEAGPSGSLELDSEFESTFGSAPRV